MIPSMCSDFAKASDPDDPGAGRARTAALPDSSTIAPLFNTSDAVLS